MELIRLNFSRVPEDEYDPEVSDILSGIINCNTSEELTIMVQNVFVKWFDEKINKRRLVNVGEGLQRIKAKYTWLNKKYNAANMGFATCLRSFFEKRFYERK